MCGKVVHQIFLFIMYYYAWSMFMTQFTVHYLKQDEYPNEDDGK